jgi:hypothetical protein
MALAHLYMGIEAIAPVALKRELMERGLTKADLASLWSVKTRQLVPEARLRLIYQNDVETHRRAKATADGFRHGSIDLAEAHEPAMQARDPSAAYLRAAVLRLASIAGDDFDILRGSPYDKPAENDAHRVVHGVITGRAEPDALAPPGHRHPSVEAKAWLGAFGHVQGETSAFVRFQMKANIADGLVLAAPNLDGGPAGTMRLVDDDGVAGFKQPFRAKYADPLA